jgi:hypothetical protein
VPEPLCAKRHAQGQNKNNSPLGSTQLSTRQVPLLKEQTANHPVQKIGRHSVIRPFNPNEVALREHPTESFDKYPR